MGSALCAQIAAAAAKLVVEDGMEYAAAKRKAARLLERRAEFRPHLGGAVWRGTATRLSAIRIALYCDDAKAAEIALLNRGVRFEVVTRPDERGPRAEVLSVSDRCDAIGAPVTVLLSVLDHDDLRGALKRSEERRVGK